MNHRSILPGVLSLVAMLMVAAALPGCGEPKTRPDPVSVMVDRTKSTSTRLSAAEQAELNPELTPRYDLALRTLVMDAGHPAEMRNYAIDAMIRRDPADARAFLADAIMLQNNWDTIRHLLVRAVELKWVDFTPAIVRNYSRPARAIGDDRRPERDALTALNPGKSVVQIVFDVFDSTNDTTTVKQRAAAWELLNRLTSNQAELVDLLSKAHARTAMVADLKSGAVDLGVVPHNVETVTWLQSLRTADNAEFWAAAKAVVATLTDEQKQGLELRHLPTLVMLANGRSALLGKTRQALGDALGAQLRGSKHYLKSAPHDGQNADHPQLFAKWRDQLNWADMVVMQVIVNIMNEPAARQLWFAEADHDRLDEATEYGGLLLANEHHTITITPYKPMIRKHDRAYVPTSQMFVDAYRSVAHYHLHAQKYSNAKYAGPGRGDLKNIGDRHRHNGLVLTFIDKNTLNVDFYRHGNVVVDLGTITR